MLILTTINVGISQSQEQQLVGTWYISKQKADIHIYKEGDRYLGKITKGYSDPPLLDVNNKNAKERKKPLVGKFILTDMKYRDGKLVDGKIYNPDNGKTFNCILELSKSDKLKVTGYVGMPLFGKTQYWYRKKE